MAETNETEAPPKKSPIVLVLIVALISAGAGGGAMAVLRPAQAKSVHKETAESDEDQDDPVKAILPLGESLVLNLADKDSRAYLRIGVQLGLAAERKPKGSEKPMDVAPIVRDVLVAVLSSKSADDLLTAEGKLKVKEELRTGVRKRLPELKVREVFFTEFLVQK